MFGSLGRELGQGLLALIYPSLCAGCGRSLAPEQAHFCPACRAQLLRDPFPSCPRCSSTVGPHSVLENGCPRCRDAVFHFERVLRLGPYEGLLRGLILRMKQAAGESLAEHVGALWAENAESALRAVGADVVIPVPLHWQRYWSRGYNQSETLALALGKKLRLPVQSRWLRRIRHNPFQRQQTPAGRWDNVKGIFQARPRPALAGKAVLLVDDVLTTGSTASEAARALRSAGAQRVVVAVLAHGPS